MLAGGVAVVGGLCFAYHVCVATLPEMGGPCFAYLALTTGYALTNICIICPKTTWCVAQPMCLRFVHIFHFLLKVWVWGVSQWCPGGCRGAAVGWSPNTNYVETFNQPWATSFKGTGYYTSCITEPLTVVFRVGWLLGCT